MKTDENTALKAASTYTPSELYGSDKADEIIAAIREEALSYAPDVTTTTSRAQIASVAAKVAKAKVAIDAIGKTLVDPIKAQAKVIDTQRKHYKDSLDVLKMEVRKPLSDWEEEQAALKARREQEVYKLEQYCITTSSTTGEVLPLARLEKQLEYIEQYELEKADLGEFEEAAKTAIQSGLVTVRAAIGTRKVLDSVAASEAETKAAIDEARKPTTPPTEDALISAKRKAWASIRKAYPDIENATLTALINAIADGSIDGVALEY